MKHNKGRLEKNPTSKMEYALDKIIFDCIATKYYKVYQAASQGLFVFRKTFLYYKISLDIFDKISNKKKRISPQ